MKTLEELKTDLAGTMQEFFAEVEALLEQGRDYRSAVMAVCKARPDLLDREKALRSHIRALDRMEQSISMADLMVWAGGPTPGATVISCAAVTRLAGAAKRLPIAQLGVRYKGRQKIEITRPMLAEVVANFRKRDTGEVPIDYEHAIEMAAGAGGPVPAAGWIKSIDDAPDGDGILWGTVVWTPQAAQMIESGQYKYISPVIDPNVRDNKTGEEQGWTLTSAALTNLPILQGMPALVLSETGRVGETRKERQVSNDGDAQTELCLRIKKVMAAETGLNYPAAMRKVMIDDPDLARRYRSTWGGAADARLNNNQVQSEIHSLVQQKVAASEGEMGYAAAFKAVLSERPDLERRYKAALR